MKLKNSLCIIILFSSFCAYSLEGVITVLEAPAWKKPNQSSVIVQYFRKGDTVTIIDIPITNSRFIPVWDNLAKPAFIDAKHVKVYSGDSAELQTKSLNQDPTDYRMDEPLPDNYPISHKQEGNIWYKINR